MECVLDWVVRELRMTKRWQIEILHIEGVVEKDENGQELGVGDAISYKDHAQLYKL